MLPSSEQAFWRAHLLGLTLVGRGESSYCKPDSNPTRMIIIPKLKISPAFTDFSVPKNQYAVEASTVTDTSKATIPLFMIIRVNYF
jgi:hypothetical protein